jgi:DNA-binding transcriptional LysR family regulator
MMLVVSAKHPLAAAGADYTAFAGEPFLGFALQKETPAETLERVKSAISKYGLTPPSIKIVPNSESVIVELELGHGVGIMPGLFNRVFSNRNLKTYRTDVTMPLMCVWRKNDLRRETELYVECLCEEYNRAPEETPATQSV